MAQERQHHTQKARLHGVVNKDGHYQEVSTVFIVTLSTIKLHAQRKYTYI